MTGTQMLDAVEQICLNESGDRSVAPEREMLLDYLNDGISEIISIYEWDWAMVALRPTIALFTGKRNYSLPLNFGDNFVRYGFYDGTKWLCKLSDPVNNTEAFLNYLAPAQFFTRNIASTLTGPPSIYTITTLPNGRREILVDQPPSSTYGAFVINGLYIPTDWILDEEAQLPPLPGNAAVLKYFLLKRIFSSPAYLNPPLAQLYGSEYDRHFGFLVTAAQRQRQGQIIPGNVLINNYSQLDSGGI